MSKLTNFRTSFLSLFVKLVLLFLGLYVGISYSWYWVNKPNFNYVQDNVWQTNLTILSQPISEIWADSVVSRWYDWQDIDEQKVGINAEFLLIQNQNNSSEVFQDFRNNVSIKNTRAFFGALQTAAVVEPINYNGEWSLVFCSQSVCKKSNIYSTGKIKILVDGDMKLWALTKENQWKQLKLVEYIPRNTHKDILFI